MTDRDPWTGPPPDAPVPGERPDVGGSGRGHIRHQEPGTTTPRPPGVAEQRAYQRAVEEALAETVERERGRRRKRRLLIGGASAVGVAALVGGLYAAARPAETTARCVDQNQIAVDDDNCDPNSVSARGGSVGPGPVFLIGGGRYRHYYGDRGRVGSGPAGSFVSGGSYVRPKDAKITDTSGKTIQRGGFGIRGSSGG